MHYRIKIYVFIIMFIPMVIFAVNNWVDFAGTINLYQEFYSTDNESRSKPSSTTRAMFVDPDIYLFDRALKLNFQFRLTTEEDSEKQGLQSVIINPKWKWGELYALEFTPTMTKYTLRGQPITGGGFSFYPEKFHTAIYVGRTQRAIVSNDASASFEQNMFAANIGLGNRSSDYIEINVSRFVDDISSIEDSLVYEDTTTIDDYFVDSLFNNQDSLMNRLAITPQENLVTSLAFKKNLNKQFSINGEFATCFYTRNAISEEYEKSETPAGEFLGSLFNFRHSSNYDFAYNFAFTTNLENMKWNVSFEDIYPGFISLGVPSLKTDRRTLGSALSIKLMESKMRFSNNIGYSSDNLLKHDKYTNTGLSMNNSLIIIPINTLNFNIAHTYVKQKNDADNDTSKIDYTVNSINIGIGYMFTLKGKNYSINANWGTQNSLSDNILAEFKQTQNNFALGISIPITQTITNSPSLSFISSETGNSDFSTFSISDNTSIKLLKNTVNGNLRLSMSFQENQSNFRLSSGLSYKPFGAKYGSIYADYRFSSCSFTKEIASDDFSENTFRLGYEYQF